MAARYAAQRMQNHRTPNHCANTPYLTDTSGLVLPPAVWSPCALEMSSLLVGVNPHWLR